ncbi:hypothetical protein ARMSODRAFT_598037 [Armillaria solidipes]|uniref:Uncharacterized protein n=1 Tax=Armillaria solidipes TaxID=1076256 RepID=A0A2H3AV44_9AGAR|nr:hypothetical protein ARMSODRAFT_598037 [Armillaria solidipes]
MELSVHLSSIRKKPGRHHRLIICFWLLNSSIVPLVGITSLVPCNPETFASERSTLAPSLSHCSSITWAAVFDCIGEALRSVVFCLAAIIECIVAAITGVLVFILDILTCRCCRGPRHSTVS